MAELTWKDGKCRCSWANPQNELYVRYHDEEWGVPVHDDHKLFEMLILEFFQAGLSWECILNKREGFRQALDGFDAEKWTSGIGAYMFVDCTVRQNADGTWTYEVGAEAIS